MKRTLGDIRTNLDHVGCDNETAREMADEIERLRAWKEEHPYSELDMDMHVDAVTKDLRAAVDIARSALLRIEQGSESARASVTRALERLTNGKPLNIQEPT